MISSPTAAKNSGLNPLRSRPNRCLSVGLSLMLGISTGCRSLDNFSSSPEPAPPIVDPSETTETIIATAASTPAIAPITQVGFQDLLEGARAESEKDDGEEEDKDRGKDSDEEKNSERDNDDMRLDSAGMLDVNIEPITLEDPSGFTGGNWDAGMTLESIESIALSNNPTIAELVATTQKAAGFRNQVGLRANPTMGYDGVQFADEGTDQHTVFISQTIVTADKLQLNRSILNEALRAQLLQLEAQKYRVATDVRIAFYEALAAQRQVELIRDFRSVVDKGLDIAEQLKKAQEGSQLEVVQAKVQKNEIELALRQAEIRYDAAWRELAAIAGNSEMTSATLQGRLPDTEAALDWASVATTMISASPEYQSAEARVSQARANLCRQEVQPIPNIEVELASGFDNATDSGMINFRIGAPMPLFNKNQGNIAAARAEQVRASREVQRIANSIQARLAVVSRDYDSSLVAVEQYASDILPNAEEGLELAEIAYRAGETSFVQVLVARRTYFDTNLQYIRSQAQLAQARARVDGFVLTGALDPVIDDSGDDSLRGLTLSQQ